MKEGSGGSLYRIGTNADAAARGNDNGIDTTALRSTRDSTEITDVSDAVEHKDERQHAIFKKRGHNIRQAAIIDCRHLRYDSLMILACNAVESFDRHALNGYAGFAGHTAKTYCEVAVKVFLNEEFVDSATGLDSLEGGMHSKDIIVAVHSV